MDTQPRLAYGLAPPACVQPATSLSLTRLTMLEPECIHNSLVDTFVANFMELNRVVFPPPMRIEADIHTDL